MKKFNKVSIVGTGLIGGSIALAVKQKKIARLVVGISRHKKSIDHAKKIRAIDSGSCSLKLLEGSDLVILAMPVDKILAFANSIKKIVGKDCIVTDVGSTKSEIVAKLNKVFPNFVGAHPVAGSEKRGIKFASAGLFKDALCILTPTNKTNRRALAGVSFLWRRIGATVSFMDPAEHDRILSYVSHLPHVVAFSLINAVPFEFLKFAGNSLKDTTRISAADPEMWKSIFLTNRKNVLGSIDELESKIKDLRKAISSRDGNKLNKLLFLANSKRTILK